MGRTLGNSEQRNTAEKLDKYRTIAKKNSFWPYQVNSVFQTRQNEEDLTFPSKEKKKV